MKAFKGTFFLLLVAIVLGGLTYYELSTEDTRKAAETAKDQLFSDFKEPDVQALKIDQGIGVPPLVLKREGESWKMESPIKDDADAFQATSLVRELMSEKVLKLDAKGKSAESFGITDKGLTVTFTTKGGEKVVHVSADAAFDGSRYLQRKGDTSVLIAEKKWSALLEKSPQELREKNIWSSNEDVSEVRLKHPGLRQELVFKKAEGKWVEQKHPNVKVDNEAVDAFVSSVRNARALNWVSEDQSKEALKKAGIKSGVAYIALNQYRIDYNLTKDNLVAIASTRPGIMRVNAADRPLWEKPWSAFRDRKFPFEFKRDESQRLSMKAGKREYSLVKQNGTWLVENLESGKILSQDKLTAIFDQLQGLQAADFSEKRALGKVETRITLSNSEGKPQLELEVGAKQKLDKAEAYLAKTNLSDEILLIEAAKIEPIIKAELTVDAQSAKPEVNPVENSSTQSANPAAQKPEPPHSH